VEEDSMEIIFSNPDFNESEASDNSEKSILMNFKREL
jgi:hypothetical protein